MTTNNRRHQGLTQVAKVFGFILFGAAVFVIFNVFSITEAPETSTSLPTAMIRRDADGPKIFAQRMFHLDLKGAPPKVSFYDELFGFIRRLGFDGVLLEYEDMFPYSGRLSVLRAKHAYSEADVKTILKAAAEHRLDIVPLVQTFGHMEFVLKHEAFINLREVPDKADTICPSDNRSIALIHDLLSQVRNAHPHAKSIHIGADEAWHIAKDERCLERLHSPALNGSIDKLKVAHIASVAKYAKENLQFEQVYAWNDLFDKINVSILIEAKLKDYLIPVIWGYASDVTAADYFPNGMFTRYSEVFPNMLFAGVFKGADGATQTFVNAEKYLANLASYLHLYRQHEAELSGRVTGMVLTGWSRFWHGIPLCEILPEGLPVLVLEAIYMNDPSLTYDALFAKALDFLNCSSGVHRSESTISQLNFNGFVYVPRKIAVFGNCRFPGADVFRLIERLHLLRWKQNVAIDDQAPKLAEERALLKRDFAALLPTYFYDDTVEEFISQNVDLHETTTTPAF